jgi:hypothetical protein
MITRAKSEHKECAAQPVPRSPASPKFQISTSPRTALESGASFTFVNVAPKRRCDCCQCNRAPLLDANLLWMGRVDMPRGTMSM